MLTALVVLLRSIGLMRRRHRAVALENLARRQQLAARTVTRPQLRTSNRLFWVLLAKGWRERKWHGGCLVRIVTVKGKEKGSEDTFNVVKDTLVADSVIRLVERA